MNTIDQQCACEIADTIVIDTMFGLFQERHVLVVNKNCIDTPTFRTPYVGINSDGDNPTIEEGHGTMYCIRLFWDPENNDGLHYGSSDLDVQGEGRIECCTEYHKLMPPQRKR